MLSSGARFAATGFEQDDRIELTPQRGGRYSARIDPGRRYAIWAEQEEESCTRYSSLVFSEALRTRYDLVESETRATPLPVRVYGLEAWRPHGPLRFTLLEGQGVGARQPLELDATGSCELPPGPGPARIRVDSRHGFVSLHWVLRDPAQRAAWLQKDAASFEIWAARRERELPMLPNPYRDGYPKKDAGAILLPRPVEFAYRVQAQEDRSPLAGMRAYVGNPDDVYDNAIFESDASGELTIVFPLVDHWDGFLACDQRYYAVLAMPGRTPRVVVHDVDELWSLIGAGELDLRSNRARPKRLTFRAIDSVWIQLENMPQAASAPFAVRTPILDTSEDRCAAPVFGLVMRPDERGRLLLPGAWAGSMGFHAVARLDRARAESPARIVPLLFSYRLQTSTVDGGRPDLELSVRLPDGRRPREAILRYFHGAHPDAARYVSAADEVQFPTYGLDARARCLVPRSPAVVHCWVQTEDHAGFVSHLECIAGDELELELQPRHVLRGRIVNAGGLAGGSVEIRIRSLQLAGVPDAISHCATKANQGLGTVHSDEEGRFELPLFLPGPGTLYVELLQRKGTSTRTVHTVLQVDPRRSEVVPLTVP